MLALPTTILSGRLDLIRAAELHSNELASTRSTENQNRVVSLRGRPTEVIARPNVRVGSYEHYREFVRQSVNLVGTNTREASAG